MAHTSAQGRRSLSEAVLTSCEESQPPAKRQKRKTVACRRCHAQKIKCDGSNPCGNCLLSENECAYPVRDRRVTVSENYIQQLLAENERLKQNISNENDSRTEEGIDDANITVNADHEKDGDNPLIEKEAWFLPYDPSPIFIGEAACTAFSTRLRQLLVRHPTETHIPRTHFVQDTQLAAALNTTAPWPSRPQAFLLVDTAFRTIGRCYHLSPASAVRNTLERAYQDLQSLDQLTICKLFLFFALGDAYSTRPSLEDTGSLPGLHYFSRARRILQVVPERPKIDHIEILVLFSLYSLAMNRRHSAYRFVGSAMRLGLTIGLHQNMIERQLPDKSTRQRRVRLWWTIYVLDRMIGSKVGYPYLLRDEDIEVDLPTDEGLTDVQRGDFLDADYLIASVSLAKIAGGIISSLYSRRKTGDTFSRRVQMVFTQLRDWVETLPVSMQLRSEDTSSQVARHIVMLHLSFNQVRPCTSRRSKFYSSLRCSAPAPRILLVRIDDFLQLSLICTKRTGISKCVILATRPILLHVFRISNGINTSENEQIPQATSALAATCAHSARHSYRLLMRSWIDGSFSILDYLSAQYLFASATVLAISSLSGFRDAANNHADQSDLESSIHLLGQLSRLGNLAASEFCHHLNAVSRCSSSFRAGRAADQTRLEVREGTVADVAGFPLDGRVRPDTVTTEMAIFGPLVGDFLTQTDTELGVHLLLDNALDWGSWSATPAQDGNIDIGL